MIRRLLICLVVGLGLTTGSFVALAKVLAPAPVPASGFFEPRTILALYDSRKDPDVRQTRAQRYAAMPLNHLGLKLRFWDLAEGAPSTAALEDVRGILAWLYDGKPLDAKAYLNWANSVIDAGYRFVLMGNVVGSISESDDPETYAAARALTERLGVVLGDRFVSTPYRAKFQIYQRAVVGFEWDISKAPTAFHESALASGVNAVAHLTINAGAPTNERGVLVATSENGGYVQSGYDIRLAGADTRIRWIIEPFNFFAMVFGTANLPKPDVTTVVGRRLYYSHIDGDGWRSLSSADGYRDYPVSAADVIFETAISAFPDLPVTVAPIGADLDPAWFGNNSAQATARRIFSAPQVEAAHHTYTHPFAWEFFEHYDREIEQEISRIGGVGAKKQRAHRDSGDDPLSGYDAARAYAQRLFSLEHEIVGARDFIQQFLPPGKKVDLVQWSGDTQPYVAAIKAADRAGILNINGGDSRYDGEYPTLATVAGVEFDGARQIFASASNENTYTELWTRRFYGFRFLRETLRRTEIPRRILPHNVYYHMYSGEKTAALKALLENLNDANKAEIAPVSTSTYVRIAEGFFDVKFERLDNQTWRVVERGGLQTLRFDSAERTPDYGRSRGILGHRIVNGSLYVALDPANVAPVLALGGEGRSARAYLGQSRWLTQGLRIAEAGFAYQANGFGAGEYVWQDVPSGDYRINAALDGQTVWQGNATVDQTGTLAFTIPANGMDGLDVNVIRHSFAAVDQKGLSR